jgi:hypothetical protein
MHSTSSSQFLARTSACKLGQSGEWHGEGVSLDMHTLARGPQHLQGRAHAVLDQPRLLPNHDGIDEGLQFRHMVILGREHATLLVSLS